MTSLFAILPTRLQIDSRGLEPTSTNMTNFALARRFGRKSCTLQLSSREGTWRIYLPQCWSKKFCGTGLSLESTFCLLLASNHHASASYMALANSALSMHCLERALSAGLLRTSQILIFCWPCISIYLFLNISQLDALNFTISLFQASTCFEHMCSSSGGQNCIIQSLVSSHL